MKGRSALLSVMLVLAAGTLLTAGAAGANEGTKRSSDTASTGTASKAAIKQQDEETMRIEGEKRFHANCSRCHQYPHKFPARMMATIVRHMRVRATIAEEDMRLVLRYLTQ